MVTLKVANIVLFLLRLSNAFRVSYKDKASYPSIHNVVSFKPPQPIRRTDAGNEITIDIEKLDMHRIKQDDTAFRKQIMGGLEHVFLEGNNTRRVTKFFPNRPFEYFRAYELQVRSKLADVQLQLIYMARSKIKNFQMQGNVKTDSSAYRIGFVNRKLEDLAFKARRYYITMVEKQNQKKWDMETNSILNLHHKVVMAHHDFVRLFMVQMALHQRLEEYEGNPIHSLDQLTDIRFRRFRDSKQFQT